MRHCYNVREPSAYDKILEFLSPSNSVRRNQWDRELIAVNEARERKLDIASDDH